MRRRIKTLETLLKQILESPEGIEYRNRKSKEYQKEYRTKNKDKKPHKDYQKDLLKLTYQNMFIIFDTKIYYFFF